MTFAELEPGDVFVLRWWLDVGPTSRHYLVVKKEGKLLSVLRLEEEFMGLSDIDIDIFEEVATRREVYIVDVYRSDAT